jgi:hypothetical protein
MVEKIWFISHVLNDNLTISMMKKNIFLIIVPFAAIVMATYTTAEAQTKWETRFALNVSPHNGERFDHVQNYDVYTAEVGVVYNERFLVGVGAGFTDAELLGEPFSYVEQYIPVYGDVKYYQPVLKWLKVFAGIEMGCEFRHLTESQKEFTHLKDNEFLFYPQAGVFFKVFGRLGVEASIGKRMTFCDMWMPTFSIVF